MYSPEEEAKLPVNGLQEYIMAVHANVLGEDYPHHVRTQGEVSLWAQEKFNTHKHITHKWKESKSKQHVKGVESEALAVVVGADKNPTWVSVHWEYNDNSSVNFITLSITVNGSDLCMDYNMTTMTVAVSLCYPSSVPATNRDTTQHWAWGNDALVRPYDYPDYCLSSSFLEGDPRFYLRPCNFDDVSQHLAWQGGMIPAIGKESGSIGWSVYSVGLVLASSLPN